MDTENTIYLDLKDGRVVIELDPAARIVMCSALGEQKLIVHAIQLGALDFIVKPFVPQRVVSAIQKAVGKTRSPGSTE